MHEVEALIELALDGAAILLVVLVICVEVLDLFLGVLEVATARGGVFGTKASGDPYGRAQEGYHVLDLGLDAGDDLDGRTSSTDNGNGLTLQVVVVVPLGRVHQLALVEIETGDVGVFPGVEDTRGRDEDIALVFLLLTGSSQDGKLPLS